MRKTTYRFSSNSQTLDEILGKPALIRGEDEAQYRRLLSAVTDEIQPQTLFDQIRVRELTDKLWDQRRNREGVAALVETAFVRALAHLLKESMLREVPADPSLEFPHPLILEPLHISEVQAQEYYNTETTATRRRKLNAILARYGITEDQIRAKAMEICGSSIQMFKRMEESNERFIRRALKDQDRLTRKRPETPSIAPSDEPVD